MPITVVLNIYTTKSDVHVRVRTSKNQREIEAKPEMDAKMKDWRPDSAT